MAWQRSRRHVESLRQLRCTRGRPRRCRTRWHSGRRTARPPARLSGASLAHTACSQRKAPRPRSSEVHPPTLVRRDRECVYRAHITASPERKARGRFVCVRGGGYLSSPVAVRMKPAIMNQPPPTQNRIRVHRGWTGYTTTMYAHATIHAAAPMMFGIWKRFTRAGCV